jgi:hypothetical protein
VLTEVLATNWEEAISSPIALFMREQGYCLFGKTYNTFIFRDAQA